MRVSLAGMAMDWLQLVPAINTSEMTPNPICPESPCIEEHFGVCWASVALKLADFLCCKVAALLLQKFELRISPSLTKTCTTTSLCHLPDVNPLCTESPCIEEHFGVCWASEALTEFG